MLHRSSLPKVPPTPSLRSPELGPPPSRAPAHVTGVGVQSGTELQLRELSHLRAVAGLLYPVGTSECRGIPTTQRLLQGELMIVLSRPPAPAGDSTPWGHPGRLPGRTAVASHAPSAGFRRCMHCTRGCARWGRPPAPGGGGAVRSKNKVCAHTIGLQFRAPLINSIAFGKSTSQRIYREQHTPKIGWKLHKYRLKHALHTLDDHFR